MSKAKPHTILRAEDGRGKIRRFGLVGQGDNPGAKFLSMKSVSRLFRWAGKESPDPISDYVDACDRLWTGIDEVIDSSPEDEGQRLQALTLSFKGEVQQMDMPDFPEQALDNAIEAVSRAEGTLPASAREDFAKAVSELGIAINLEDSVSEPNAKTDAEKMGLEEALGLVPDEAKPAIEQALAGKMEEDEPMEDPDSEGSGEEDGGGEEEDKSVPEAKKSSESETLKTMQDQMKAMADKLEASESKVKRMEEEKETEALVAKAKSLKLASETDDLVEILRKAPEAGERVLKALSAQFASNNQLLKSMGKYGSDEDSYGTAQKALNAAKAEIMKADGVSSQQALSKLAKTHQGKELIAAYHAEKAQADEG